LLDIIHCIEYLTIAINLEFIELFLDFAETDLVNSGEIEFAIQE